ncbi:hypothetical protein MUN81_15450 [Hymenobacter sp. 5317J-9]|uniref:hypothetical protein n=1 Tax=Hymenobacter sp. 5317J-9 TaxID=2932250 RepID=UPI001FD64FDC|nr:hypothetical protein [Hymenobacter sp. 5317J-9]UOQ96631.1 hypothetical protein MUN81_15450 [Hymenobacter sp. 5317J-9]
MLIEVNTTWTVSSAGAAGAGKTFLGTGIAFDTDTHQLVAFNVARTAALLDPLPQGVHLQAGDVIHIECDIDFTATLWIYGGGMSLSSQTEATSAQYCGWTPPVAGLTCDIGTLSVSQTGTPGGITLTALVTGTPNGAWRYSLDRGPEQASADFTGVAIGTHTVRVRDTGLSGCWQEVTVVVSAAPLLQVPTGAAQGFDFVGQPLWYQPAGVPAGAEVHLELWAESAHGQEDFAAVLTLRKFADAQGRVAFQLDGLLWPLLRAWEPPAVASTASRCRGQLVNYFVRTTVYAAGQPPAYTTGPLRTALRGALPAERRDIEYFAYRLDAFAQPPFLSWRPADRRLTPEQPEWLFWLCPPGQPAVFTVRRSYVRTGFAGGAPLVEDEAVVLSGPRGPEGQLLAIPVRPRAGTDAVTLALYDADETALSPLVTFAMVDPTPQTRYLLFTNSLGGCDTLRTEGRLEGLLEGVASSSEVPPTAGGAAPHADRWTYDVTAVRKLKLATGWLRASELRWLQELVLAREIWEWQPGRVLPLDVAKRQLAYLSDANPLRGMALEYDYAFAPTAYAAL